jgi:hypothetical protein
MAAYRFVDEWFVPASPLWNVEVRKGFVRRLTPVLRPLFAWNHGWAMARGLESITARAAERQP